jgi:hypothetical protein
LELHFKAALTSSQVEADAIVAPVKTYRIKAVADVKPTISSVHDSNGVAIPQNGLTVDPDTMVSGTAAPNQQVLIYNNDVSTGVEATADAVGAWKQNLKGLALGGCSLTAVAQYGSGLESAPWKITTTSLKAPSVKEANANSLNPMAAKDTLTIRISSYIGIDVSDKVSVTWTGATEGGSYTTPNEDIDTISDREIAFRKEVVAFNLSKEVTVRYTITRGNGTPLMSQFFQLNVQNIPNSELLNSIPTIDGAVNDELDVFNLANDAKTRIAKWPLIAITQKIWLSYEGTNTDGSSFKLDYYTATPVPTDGLPNGMSPPVPLTALRALKTGTTLRIKFKVSFDGDANENQSTVFPSRDYIVRNEPLLIGNDRSLHLPNYIIASTASPYRPPSETIYSQPATGGSPPYNYAINAGNVASVTNKGVVTVKSNGIALITVTDSIGSKASYTLSVSGIKMMLKNDEIGRSWSDAKKHCAALGGRLATLQEMLTFFNIYGTGGIAGLYWPILKKYSYPWWGAWTADEKGSDSYFVNLDGETAFDGVIGWHIKTALRPVICIKDAS